MRALIDWRAGCGKSACPVLREGWGSNAPFLPLSNFGSHITVLALMMSVIALSLPEAIILRKVLKPRLIATFFGVVAAGIMLVGSLFNAIL